MFINLNVHSYYSLLMSSISIDDIISFAKYNNQKYVALVDINVLYGAIEFYDKALANNLKPIIGLQIEYKNQKTILIAKNNDGYHNLIKISSFIMSNEKYDLNSYLNGLAIICEDIGKLALLNAKEWYSFNQKMDNAIACNEVFFQSKDDFDSYKAIKAIRENLSFNDLEKFDENIDCFFITNEQSKKMFSENSLQNLEKLINQCEWSINFNSKRHIPKFDDKYVKNSKMLLQANCCDGLKSRFKTNIFDKKYLDRLKNELEIIDEMGFNDYFLVVQDYVNFAKNNGILVGPGRGSAAGSLVSYALGITDIDPIKNNLIFERFLNPQRKTMPDIDIDFMDNRRDEIVEYLFEKYSKQRVAHIITFQRIKAKMAIRDVARILGIDLKVVGLITKLFNFDNENDIDLAIKNDVNIKKQAELYPDLFKLASKLVGTPRQIGIHAAGIIISDTNLDEIVPTQESSDGILLTQYSMEYLERLGLIKMDILGLTNLTIINEIINVINKTQKKIINLHEIPLNDQNVFKLLIEGKTLGIFQLESSGMTKLIMRIKPKSIEDISITSALFRPGPQQNIWNYLNNRNHPQQIKYLNDAFEKVLKSTSGIIIYQEQVIDIVCLVANYSLAEADNFRRVISKKDVNKMFALKEKFITAAVRNNYSESEANRIYEYIETFANYGFNHSHSLAYSYISYWLAYLKTYFPEEFYCVLMTYCSGSADKLNVLIKEATQLGIKILPPSIVNSGYGFGLTKKTIIFGLSAIKGIGNETIRKIIEIRKKMINNFDNYLTAISTLVKNGISQSYLKILIKAGCFDSLNNNRKYLLINLDEIFSKSKTIDVNGKFIIQPKFVNVELTSDDIENFEKDQKDILGVNFKLGE